MPEGWAAALTAVTSGVSNVMSSVTGEPLLLALVFGFLFLRKSAGVVKKLLRLGGTN